VNNIASDDQKGFIAEPKTSPLVFRALPTAEDRFPTRLKCRWLLSLDRSSLGS